jgi:hypothetical protein
VARLDTSFEAVAEKVASTSPRKWEILTLQEDWKPEIKMQVLRLNALGSLFNFEFVVLGYTRLTPHLHGKFICSELEREKIRTLIEFPRDHFKTTCATIGAPMWWGLPFTEEDERLMRLLGYGDEWIRWMKRAHNTCTRTLIASETRPNARKFGDKIENHYDVNRLFKSLFHEIIPRGNERWTQDSRIHRRLNDGTYQSEGTYDFIGADVALQSNHYDRIIEDDLIGEDAVDSETVMRGVIDWHKKLPGCFDSIPGNPDELGDQLIIGNRWSHKDLNSHVREKEKTYKILTHGAEGGCCEFHPPGLPIFPEEFSMIKLNHIRETEGAYNYSCHFLNNPTAPGATKFKKHWLRDYSRSVWEVGKLTAQNTANYFQLSPKMRSMTIEQVDKESGANPRGLRLAMHHEVSIGEVMDDVRAADLDRVMLIRPSYASEWGSVRNAILVLGIYTLPKEHRRIYLLDAWAKECSHEEWIDAAIGERSASPGLAWKWKIHRLYGEFETSAQQGWANLFKEKLNLRSATNRFAIYPVKAEHSESAKFKSIVGMEAIYQSGAWWMPKEGEARDLFIREYQDFPHGATMDLLYLAGLSPHTFGLSSRSEQLKWIANEQQRHRERMQHIGNAGY